MKRTHFFSAIAVAALAACSLGAQAGTNIWTISDTGGDDLRGGNHAYIRLSFVDGTYSSEQMLSAGLPGGSSVTNLITFPENFTYAQISAITIRHDGNPRSGEPFDTYDNWDLRRVRLLGLYDSRADANYGGFVQRFTGSLRQVTIQLQGGGPDFVIPRILGRASGGVEVHVSNNGMLAGYVTALSCRGQHGTATLRLRSSLAPGATRPFVVRSVGAVGPVVCRVWGTGLDTRPEVVTTNNSRTRFF